MLLKLVSAIPILLCFAIAAAVAQPRKSNQPAATTQGDTKTLTQRSKTWEITLEPITTVPQTYGMPQAPYGTNLLQVTMAVRYLGPESEVAGPLLSVIGPSGDEYKMVRGFLSIDANYIGDSMQYVGWLQSGREDKPDKMLLRPQTTIKGVIYYVAVGEKEPLDQLKLKFADIAPFPFAVLKK